MIWCKDDPRLRASTRHGGAEKFFFSVAKSPRGRPVGGGDVHRSRGMGVSTPIIISERHNFYEKLFEKTLNLSGAAYHAKLIVFFIATNSDLQSCEII